MNKSIQLASFLLLVSLGGTVLAANPMLERATPAQVRQVSLQMTGTGTQGNTLGLRVDTADGPLDLVLTPATQMQAQAAPMVSAIRDGRTRLYRGSVAGQTGSWVRMSRIDGAWLGAIQVEGKLWLMDPARQHPQLARQLGLGARDSLVFTLDDFQSLQAVDSGGLVPPLAALSRNPQAGSGESTAATTTTRFLGVTLVLDTEFQAHYGSSAASTAVGILNIVGGFYFAQADTQVYLYSLKLLASNGTMTSTDAETLLDAFSIYSQNSLSFSGVAHLLSGKDFDGSTIGLAWLGTLCSSKYGTGVDQVTYGAAAGASTLAHEMGHNYNASHDSDGNSCPASGYIMNAITNLGSPPTTFSNCSLNYFNSYLANNNTSCLAPRPDRIFANGFD